MKIGILGTLGTLISYCALIGIFPTYTTIEKWYAKYAKGATVCAPSSAFAVSITHTFINTKTHTIIGDDDGKMQRRELHIPIQHDSELHEKRLSLLLQGGIGRRSSPATEARCGCGGIIQVIDYGDYGQVSLRGGQMNPTCQCCGQEILPGEKSVLVSYGSISKRGNHYAKTGVDVFHAKCDVAIRSEVGK